ncbi:MAG: cellulase family glycosylhydrolase [Lewinella sp.]|nr:cellulase family glycosylhydrolase [Lewinella sp.]
MRSRGKHFGKIVLSGLVLLTWFSCSKPEDPVPAAILEVDYSAIQIAKDGGGVLVEVETTFPWTITADESWVSLSRTGAPASASVQIGASANPTDQERTSSITVRSENLTHLITLTQEAGDSIPVVVEDPVTIPPDETDMRPISSLELTAEMYAGWNIGNTLEAIGGETAWGNPLVTQLLIDSIKAAGFDAVRIPVAWSKFSDEENFTISKPWLTRVEQVVNYVLNSGMYAIINLHWDGGWMQPLYAEEEYVNNRLAIMWQQIAIQFRDYDDRLLFAGSNEVLVEGEYGTPTEENYTVQNGFNQTFVTAVRMTGGRNHYRHLVVQGYNTNINHTLSFFQMPEDVVEGRLSVEVHYYDPYNYTLNENSNITQWGAIATDPEHTETWANESWVDDQFQQMKQRFIDNGVAVILGEYGVISREEVPDSEVYRAYYLDYVTEAAAANGLVPFYWDNGYLGNHSMALFNRSTGEQAYPAIIHAIVVDD